MGKSRNKRKIDIWELKKNTVTKIKNSVAKSISQLDTKKDGELEDK